MNFTGVLASTGSMAATGASVGGPWGAAIGGAIGLGKGLYDGIQGDRAAEARHNEAVRQSMVSQEQAMQGGMGMAAARQEFKPTTMPQENHSTEQLLAGLLGSASVANSLGLFNAAPAVVTPPPLTKLAAPAT